MVYVTKGEKENSITNSKGEDILIICTSVLLTHFKVDIISEVF